MTELCWKIIIWRGRERGGESMSGALIDHQSIGWLAEKLLGKWIVIGQLANGIIADWFSDFLGFLNGVQVFFDWNRWDEDVNRWRQSCAVINSPPVEWCVRLNLVCLHARVSVPGLGRDLLRWFTSFSIGYSRDFSYLLSEPGHRSGDWIKPNWTVRYTCYYFVKAQLRDYDYDAVWWTLMNF